MRGKNEPSSWQGEVMDVIKNVKLYQPARGRMLPSRADEAADTE